MKFSTIIILILTMLVSISFDYKTLGYKWYGTRPEVHYEIFEEGTPDVTNEFEFVKSSFKVWEDISSATISFKCDGITDNGYIGLDSVNRVRWYENEKEKWKYGNHVLGVCRTYYYGNKIIDSDIVLNGKTFQWATDFTDPNTKNRFDIAHVLVHEIGHFLGLDHSSVENSVMWASASAADTSNRVLSLDDSAGVTYLYPLNSYSNIAPVITSIAPTNAVVGSRYDYQVIAEDAENEPLLYWLSNNKPVAMKIDSNTGLITWFPKFLDLGTHTVTVYVKDPHGASDYQTFSISVGDLMIYTEDATLNYGDTAIIPVMITNMSEYNILSMQFGLTFGNELGSIIAIDTVGCLLGGKSMASNVQSDTIRIAVADADAFVGEGVLFRVKILPKQDECNFTLNLHFVDLMFNDGDPVPTEKVGNLEVPCPPPASKPYINGVVRHEFSTIGIDSAIATLSGSEYFDTVYANIKTDNDGYFRLPNIQNISYKIEVSKEKGDTRGAVSAWDASMILREVVELIEFKDYEHQNDAADCNFNGMISAYDAALILRFIVGYEDGTRIGEWDIYEDTTIDIEKSTFDIEFLGYMFGDVSGNWKDASAAKTLPISKSTLTIPDLEVTGNLTENKEVIYSTNLSLEIHEEIMSGEFEFIYDTTLFELINVKSSIALTGFLISWKANAGKIKIAFAGSKKIQFNGDMITLEFAGADENLEGSVLELETGIMKFNESSTAKMVRVSSIKTKNIDGLVKVFPNPFNPLVNIAYNVKNTSKGSIEIFNTSGKLIKSLKNGTLQSGVNKVSWNGKDYNNNNVSSGIYLLKVKIGENYSTTSKLLLMK